MKIYEYTYKKGVEWALIFERFDDIRVKDETIQRYTPILQYLEQEMDPEA